jgi:succinoglycan biosynthesis transport protein ExoP
VLANLNERLSVVRERDSAVISINVRTKTPELSARIANAIAAAHVLRRAALSLSDTAEASQWLEQEIARLRVKVQEAEDAVANYRVDNDLFTGSDNTSILNQQLTAISTQITAAMERKNAALSRSNLIRELIASGQPIENVQDVRDSVVIQQLSETKANLQGELAQRSSTLLGNHPTIRALRAQIRAIEEQITVEARRVANALEAQARIEGDLEQQLREDLTRAKLSVSTATKDNVTLESLQRDAKAQRDLLESYLLRYSDASSRATAGSALPDVRQITVAAPSVVPASPKTTLILGAVGFVALALQIGAILFGELMSGRALAPSSFDRQEEVYDEPEAEGAYAEQEPRPSRICSISICSRSRSPRIEAAAISNTRRTTPSSCHPTTSHDPDAFQDVPENERDAPMQMFADEPEADDFEALRTKSSVADRAGRA